jgi:hypothetical protein
MRPQGKSKLTSRPNVITQILGSCPISGRFPCSYHSGVTPQKLESGRTLGISSILHQVFHPSSALSHKLG